MFAGVLLFGVCLFRIVLLFVCWLLVAFVTSVFGFWLFDCGGCCSLLVFCPLVVWVIDLSVAGGVCLLSCLLLRVCGCWWLLPWFV